MSIYHITFVDSDEVKYWGLEPFSVEAETLDKATIAMTKMYSDIASFCIKVVDSDGFDVTVSSDMLLYTRCRSYPTLQDL